MYAAFAAFLGIMLLLAGISLNPSYAQAETAQQTEVMTLENGTYLIEVELKGGSGRASVYSPTQLVVEGGQVTASIVWSSPNYDYMIVDGERYEPTNNEGNSTFSIPIKTLGVPIKVTADTTAMSEPHEIDYELIFNTESLQVVNDKALTIGRLLPTRQMAIATVIGVLSAIIIVFLMRLSNTE